MLNQLQCYQWHVHGRLRKISEKRVMVFLLKYQIRFYNIL